MMKKVDEWLLSELSEMQRSHMAWRLDHKTACGYVTAGRLARMALGDMTLVDVFEIYGGTSTRSAKIHARKVLEFQSGSAPVQRGLSRLLGHRCRVDGVMTVGEIIAELEKYPREWCVGIADHDREENEVDGAVRGVRVREVGNSRDPGYLPEVRIILGS